MFRWFELIGLDKCINSLRVFFYSYKEFLPNWACYSLPDALWVYSFSSILIIVWGNQFESAKFWLLIPLYSGVVIEIAQGIKIFPGTFDILDLTLTTIALFLSIIIIKPKFKKYEKQEQEF